MSNLNFSEFMTFFPKGLNNFKIQTRFKLELFLEFLIQNLGGFGSWVKIKKVRFYIFEVGAIQNY
jgi:hypothetical protein